MKFLAVAFVLLVISYVSGLVVPDGFGAPYSSQIVRLDDVDSDGGLDTSSRSDFRQRRDLTCDLFSFESQVVTPNHAACALKCVGMGRGGGHCEGTTCVCRNDKWVPW